MTAREHILDPAHIHHEWDADLPPVLTVRSGDVVHCDLKAAGDGQVWPGATYAEAKFDFETLYNLGGPLWVEGAQPGDTLQIDVLVLEPGDWGWSAFLPEFGLLHEDFAGGYIRTFELSGGQTTIVPGIEIPLAPFLGVMGNHPGEPRRQLPFPPHQGGGNMDNRHLTVGTTVWLPIWMEGALFSCGDPHAAQGDGEVSVTAIECPMTASLRLTLHKQSSESPSFRVPAGAVSTKDVAGYHATTGLDADLMVGAKKATRAMISWLVAEHGLSREDAYILCSVAGDLKILEIVDAGVWNVAMTMPLGIFRS
jgi:acetamidase/formamidase